MSTPTLEELKYPVGKYQPPALFDESIRQQWIQEIADLPAQLSAAVAGLSEAQLDTPYRDGGWTVRQLVHHVADSHLNSYIRFRWALTEDVPVIKAYEEKLWAELPDAKHMPVGVSLTLLASLHERWVNLLTQMTADQFNRTLRHPASGENSLNRMLGLYAWHGRHHTAHVTNLRRRLSI